VDGRLFPEGIESFQFFMTIKNLARRHSLFTVMERQIGYKRMKKVFTNPFSNGF
jgi:hypothetical protein